MSIRDHHHEMVDPADLVGLHTLTAWTTFPSYRSFRAIMHGIEAAPPHNDPNDGLYWHGTGIRTRDARVPFEYPFCYDQQFTLTARPQRTAFRPTAFEIVSDGEWDVIDIKIGNRSQLVVQGPLPGRIFQMEGGAGTTSSDNLISFETCQTAMDLVVVARLSDWSMDAPIGLFLELDGTPMWFMPEGIVRKPGSGAAVGLRQARDVARRVTKSQRVAPRVLSFHQVGMVTYATDEGTGLVVMTMTPRRRDEYTVRFDINGTELDPRTARGDMAPIASAR